MKQVSILESFQWAKSLYPILKQYEDDGMKYYKVIANHADIKNRNDRVYTDEELQRAASSLSRRPLNINHDPKRELPFPENQVVISRYEDKQVECIIQVADPKINQMIESGEIHAVSVEGMYLDGSKNTKETEYPTSLHFEALALLTRDDQPGDPMAQIVKESRPNGITLSGLIMEKIQLTNEAEWSSSFISDLPDDAFAYVEPGGKKDEQGKTVPRSFRHLPYKDAKGNVDKPHLRNALSRLPQTSLPPQAKAAARKKLVAAAKDAGIETADESLSKAFEAFQKGYIDSKIFNLISREYGLREDDDDDSDADCDSITNPTGKTPSSDPQTWSSPAPAASASPEAKNQGQSKGSSGIERDVSQVTGSSEPQMKSQQDFKGEAPKMEPKMIDPNGSQSMPKMDYPLDANPLAITNDSESPSKTESGSKIKVTPQKAPDLMSALQNATPNVEVTFEFA